MSADRNAAVQRSNGMGDLGFDFVSDVPTPVKLLFAALGVVMLVWVIAAWAFGDRNSDPGELP